MRFEAIVIGGSLGGMDAVSQILRCLPPDYPLALIIILHRLKQTKSPLVNLIKEKTDIQVKEADEKEKILPGVAYIAPADYHMLIESDKTISLDSSEKVNYSRPSIDVSFESASRIYKQNLIGVVLTGANNDGSNGLKRIAENGGLTIAQDPSDAESPVMPQAAIRACKVDHVVPLTNICKFLAELPDHGNRA